MSQQTLPTLNEIPEGLEEIAYLRRMTGWISRAPMDRAFALIRQWSNATGSDLIGVKMNPVSIDGPHGPYVVVQVDDEAPVPEVNTADHIAVCRRMWRFEVLKTLRGYLNAITHHKAVRLMSELMDEEKPLTLYLRGFALGAEETPVEDPRLDMNPGVGSTAIRTHPHDGDFQKLLLRCGLDRLVGIANRKDPTPSTVVAQLIADNSLWVQIMRGLVHIASPIVMFIEKPSEGVLIELETILELKKAQWTVVVQQAPGPPDYRDFSVGNAPDAKEQARLEARWNRTLAGFPHRLELAEAEQKLPGVIRAIETRGPRLWDGEPIAVPIPMNYGPPSALANEACDQAESLMTAAVTKITEGEFDTAEDYLYRALVRAVLSNGPGYLPAAYFGLGMCAERRCRMSECQQFFEWAAEKAREVGNDGMAKAAEARLTGCKQQSGSQEPNGTPHDIPDKAVPESSFCKGRLECWIRWWRKGKRRPSVSGNARPSDRRRSGKED